MKSLLLFVWPEEAYKYSQTILNSVVKTLVKMRDIYIASAPLITVASVI